MKLFSSRKFSMIFNRSFPIGFGGGVDCVKAANMQIFTVKPDANLVTNFFEFSQVDSLYAAGISGRNLCIPIIFGMSRISKIFYSIVQFIMIDMVYFFAWRQRVIMKPSKPMRVILDAVNYYHPISLGAPRDHSCVFSIPILGFVASEFPPKLTRVWVIVQNGAEVFCRQIVALFSNFRYAAVSHNEFLSFLVRDYRALRTLDNPVNNCGTSLPTLQVIER